MKSISVIFISILCVGCVPYPIYKTLQPSSEVTVVDTKENPIENAKVILISSSYPYGFEKTRDIKQTNANGKAYFKSNKEWRTESLMLHGSEIFFWNWCVFKDGYITYLTNYNSENKFVENPIIVLSKGGSQKCPDQLE